MSFLPRKIVRELKLALLFFLPKERRLAIERRLRGKDELNKLRAADCVIVSYGKSGRTWLRVMMSRVYQLKHGLSERHLLAFDNLHSTNPAIPRILFSHDNYIKDFTGNTESKVDYYGKKLILLVRDPADVAVSQFFQWKFRMPRRKKSLNTYPDHGQDISVFDFVLRPDSGLPKIIDFMNRWAGEVANFEHILLVRYEDMRADPKGALGQVMEFIGTPGSEDELHAAVEFASIDNMRKLEEKKVFWLAGGRMTPGDRSNPQSYKVRRAKVGGYCDYFKDGEIATLDEMVSERLSPFYGYDRRGQDKVGKGGVAKAG